MTTIIWFLLLVLWTMYTTLQTKVIKEIIMSDLLFILITVTLMLITYVDLYL